MRGFKIAKLAEDGGSRFAKLLAEASRLLLRGGPELVKALWWGAVRHDSLEWSRVDNDDELEDCLQTWASLRDLHGQFMLEFYVEPAEVTVAGDLEGATGTGDGPAGKEPPPSNPGSPPEDDSDSEMTAAPVNAQGGHGRAGNMGGPEAAAAPKSVKPVAAKGFVDGGVSYPLLRVGDRVVRGPDWKWEDQDGGARKIGVVKSNELVSQLLPAADSRGWVTVKWEASRTESMYRYKAGAVDVVKEGTAARPTKYPVGTRVCLAVGFAAIADAAKGALLPGDPGAVTEVRRGVSIGRGWQNVEGFLVRSEQSGKKWWYAEPAICRWGDAAAAIMPSFEPGARVQLRKGFENVGSKQVWAATKDEGWRLLPGAVAVVAPEGHTAHRVALMAPDAAADSDDVVRPQPEAALLFGGGQIPYIMMWGPSPCEGNVAFTAFRNPSPGRSGTIGGTHSALSATPSRRLPTWSPASWSSFQRATVGPGTRPMGPCGRARRARSWKASAATSPTASSSSTQPLAR